MSNAQQSPITRLEALAVIDAARENHDTCPCCGGRFDGVDMARDGELVFIHDESGAMHGLETRVRVGR